MEKKKTAREADGVTGIMGRKSLEPVRNHSIIEREKRKI